MTMAEWLVEFLNSGWSDLSFVERWLLIVGTLVLFGGIHIKTVRKHD